MLGYKLFSAPFKVGDGLIWPEWPSGDMFLLQLQRELTVTRHLSRVPEVGGICSGCSGCSPGSGTVVWENPGQWCSLLSEREVKKVSSSRIHPAISF